MMMMMRVLLLMALSLSTPRLAYSFLPLLTFDGNSSNHRLITQSAILMKTAEVCRDIAVSERRNFSLTSTDGLSAYIVQRACSPTGTSTSVLSSLLFYTSMATIYSSNALVDVMYLVSKEHHFDAETFEGGRDIITAGVAAVKASVKKERFLAGRFTLGLVCHTLQDFYSHSNWVELGKEAPFAALITPDQPLKNVAGPTVPTCRNCTGDDCSDNLLPDFKDQGLLTSGYFSIFSSEKPKGKCSHGGHFDRTSRTDPVGGINKDSVGSSHGSLHHKAANLALNATVELLEDIRLAVGNQNFLRLMGLSQSPALCFVIDTTGSMREDIEAARKVSFAIIDSKRGTEDEPSAYILVPFNDPGVGPLLLTTDADAFKNSINKLSPRGGGDIPEMCLSGLQIALTAAPPSSNIFVFTDAPAKDAHLKNNILALMESSKSAVTFMLTDVIRRKRSVREVVPRRVTVSESQIYRELAEASGGQVIEVSKSDISSVTSVIEDASAKAVVTVFQVIKDPGSPGNFTFTVDGSLINVTMYITGVSSLTYTLGDPTGLTQNSSVTSGPLASITKGGNLHRLSLTSKNHAGRWQIHVDSNEPYTVKVTGQSPVDFIFNIVEKHIGAHEEYNLKVGRPLSGGNITILISLTGSDTMTVERVVLFDSSVPLEVNGSIQPAQSSGSNDFVVTFTEVPLGVYVLQLEGEDRSSTTRSSTTFKRQATTKIKMSSISVVNQVNISSVEPGSSISVPFTVAKTVNGVVNESSTFKIQANNDRRYSMSTNSTVTAAPGSGGRASGTVTMTVPPEAEPGSDLTLTIEAENEDGSDLNYAVIRFAVISKVTDSTRPVCKKASPSDDCPSSSLCSSKTWEFVANFTDGINGTGIEDIRISKGNGFLNMSTVVGAEGENITLITYNASCCSPSVELTATDKVGNVGTCVGQIRQITTTAPTTTTVMTTQKTGMTAQSTTFTAAQVETTAANTQQQTTSAGGETLHLWYSLWLTLGFSLLWNQYTQ